MSATRLLVLGVVRGYGRAHGYLIGNDLLAWGADQWANVKWGSIYHALKQLTKSGSLIEDFLATRTEYELTERGELEFQKLLRNAFRRPEHRPDMLGAGLALLPALTRQDAIALLRERLAALEAQRDDAEVQLRKSQGPQHVWELYTLWGHSADSGIEWTQGLLTRLEEGKYAMAGEPGSPGKPGSWHELIEP
ncbi:helix-turn-helix transcriptional regulator [Kibdelosporangium philippinense]|uniref:Helix-turn-helix transcriptional regulator n=1 Tax=Kibdelosporangium philippinense TaxID=211113 RepID=A0ABS8Z7Z0_9PSEU|nr:helix-turn-helix transcriptional regulator [Kibdelosporangium philippinense]MCE7003989.1 helix-turn-helix transcriptional regulator [Kibdelosporangium philippinense]